MSQSDHFSYAPPCATGHCFALQEKGEKGERLERASRSAGGPPSHGLLSNSNNGSSSSSSSGNGSGSASSSSSASGAAVGTEMDTEES